MNVIFSISVSKTYLGNQTFFLLFKNELFCISGSIKVTDDQLVSSNTTLLMESLEEIKNDKFNNMKIGRSETPGNKVVLLGKDIICRFKDDEDLLKGISKSIVLKSANILRSTNFKWGESKEKLWNKVLICLNDTSLTLSSRYFKERLWKAQEALLCFRLQYNSEKSVSFGKPTLQKGTRN